MCKLNAILAVLILSCTNITSASSRLFEEVTTLFSKRSLPYVQKRAYYSQMRTPAYKPKGPSRLSENLSEMYENLPRTLDAIDKRGELYRIPNSQKQSAPLPSQDIEEINKHTVYGDLKKRINDTSINCKE